MPADPTQLVKPSPISAIMLNDKPTVPGTALSRHKMCFNLEFNIHAVQIIIETSTPNIQQNRNARPKKIRNPSETIIKKSQKNILPFIVPLNNSSYL